MVPLLWQPLMPLAVFSGPTGYLLRALLYLRFLRHPADPRPVGRAEIRTLVGAVGVPPSANARDILQHRSPSLPRWEQWRGADALPLPSTDLAARPLPGEAKAALRREMARVNGQPLHVSPRFFRRMGLSETAGALLLAEAAGEMGLSVQRFGGRGCWEVRRPAQPQE